MIARTIPTIVPAGSVEVLWLKKFTFVGAKEGGTVRVGDKELVVEVEGMVIIVGFRLSFVQEHWQIEKFLRS